MITALVFGKVTILLLLLDLVDRISAQIAQSHFALFGIFGGQFAEFLAAFFRQRGNVDADHLAVVVWRKTKLAHGDRFFDRGECTDVERLYLNCLRIRG